MAHQFKSAETFACCTWPGHDLNMTVTLPLVVDLGLWNVKSFANGAIFLDKVQGPLNKTDS